MRIFSGSLLERLSCHLLPLPPHCTLSFSLRFEASNTPLPFPCHFVNPCAIVPPSFRDVDVNFQSMLTPDIT
eukprot:m.483922 g.483922  ORF g.483922 m.483922 type:complete len:72 (-) comp67367_c0_seq1:27-242(-)